MEIEKIQNTLKDEMRSKVLSVRITPKQFNWLVKNRISATKLFNAAIAELMDKK